MCAAIIVYIPFIFFINKKHLKQKGHTASSSLYPVNDNISKMQQRDAKLR